MDAWEEVEINFESNTQNMCQQMFLRMTMTTNCGHFDAYLLTGAWGFFVSSKPANLYRISTLSYENMFDHTLEIVSYMEVNC